MKNPTLTQLANQIVALRGVAPLSSIPQPLTYKSGGHSSGMIALFLPTSTGVQFMLSGPGALPPSELHITLTYLGKADDLSRRQVKETHDLMRLISENHPPLVGHINGCGRFCNGDDDGDPFFIIPDLAALPNLRQVIIDGLRSRNIEKDKNHGFEDRGFVPHITLTYLPHAEYNPFDALEKMPVTFRAISLVLGDDRYDYPLTQGVPLLSRKALVEIVTKHAPGKHSQKTHAGKGARGKDGGKKAAKKPTKPTSASSILKDLPNNLGLLETKRRNKIISQLSELSTDELTKAFADNNKKLDSAKSDLELRNALIQTKWLEQAAKKKVKGLKKQQAKAAKSDYDVLGDIANISVLIEKIGARHTQSEAGLIQKIHNLTLDLGGECHPLTRRAGARHSQGDQVMVQRIHDDCSELGATCKATPEKDRVYSSQVLKKGKIIKAQSDAPNYKAASTPQRCANCRFFLGDPGRDWCDLFDFTADQDYVCDSWEAQRPDEIPGYVANKGVLTLRNWENSTLLQRKARDAVNNAIKAGTLKKANTKRCFRCGKRPGAEYHHIDGYSENKKLNVRAICNECHSLLTRKATLAVLTEGILILRGGRTSGNWAHVGRLGKRGGSGGGGGFGRIGVKPGVGRKTVKRAAKKKQAKASKPKVQAKPKAAAKKSPVKPKAKLPAAKKKPAIKKLDDIFDKAPKGSQKNFTNHLMNKLASGEITMADAQKLNIRFTTKETSAKLPAAKKKPATKEKPSKSSENLKPGKGEKVSDGLRLGKVPKSDAGVAIHDTVNTINSVHSDGKLTSVPVEMNDSKKFQGSFEIDPIFEKAKAINVNRNATNPHMTTAHEVGHNLDFQAIGRSGTFGDIGTTFSRKKDAKVKAKFEELQKTMNDSNAISALRDRAQGSPVEVKKGGKTLEYKPDKRYSGYMLEGREMFARGYAQYIATKSGDKKMKAELVSMRKRDKKAKINYHRQWEDDDFKAISKSFDDLFVELGWLE